MQQQLASDVERGLGLGLGLTLGFGVGFKV